LPLTGDFGKINQTEYLVSLTGFLRPLQVHFVVKFAITKIFYKFCFIHHTPILHHEQKIKYPCKVFSFVTHGNPFHE